MDLSCIISSGDLELYVLGLLPEEDAYKVEQLSLLFPEVRQELDRISQSLESLATTATVAPSPDVKMRLMQQLSALKAAENNTATATEAPVHNIKEVHTTPVIPVKAKRENKGFLMAASIGALLLSIIAVIYLARQNQQQNQQVTALQKQVNNLGQQTSIQQQQLQAATQTLQLWQDEDVRKIALTSVPGKPAALAQVFWNPKTSEVYIEDVSLPPAPAGKQYQLWAIVDGKPVDAGMLSKAANEVQKMKTFAAADAFAITLEKEGGSTTPTMEEMYVMAKAS